MTLQEQLQALEDAVKMIDGKIQVHIDLPSNAAIPDGFTEYSQAGEYQTVSRIVEAKEGIPTKRIFIIIPD